MDDRRAPQVKEIFAHPTVAGTIPFPVAQLGQTMLYGYPFSEFRQPQRCCLPLTELRQRVLIWVDRHTPAVLAGSAARPKRTVCTGGCRARLATIVPVKFASMVLAGVTLTVRTTSKSRFRSKYCW